MPKYRVTLRQTRVEIVDADNPFQAAVMASDGHGDDVEIANVTSAVGRPAGASKRVGKARKKSVKKSARVAKRRRRLSPEARARLAQNLVKARAARARNLKAAAKKTARKKATKKTARKAERPVKKRSTKRA
jgi:MetJ family transcriptional regulator, methionine regulon repressor